MRHSADDGSNTWLNGCRDLPCWEMMTDEGSLTVKVNPAQRQVSGPPRVGVRRGNPHCCHRGWGKSAHKITGDR